MKWLIFISFLIHYGFMLYNNLTSFILLLSLCSMLLLDLSSFGWTSLLGISSRSMVQQPAEYSPIVVSDLGFEISHSILTLPLFHHRSACVNAERECEEFEPVIDTGYKPFFNLILSTCHSSNGQFMLYIIQQFNICIVETSYIYTTSICWYICVYVYIVY